tara:strand:- start:1854 stop:2219 length:366 start_codon:yes stop_codon:yes gene_type:complete
MFYENQIMISNYNNLKLDFKKNLGPRNSIILKNCSQVILSIDSKINKLIFKNCNGVILNCSATISGIDIERCRNFKLNPNNPYDLKYVDCYRSYLIINHNEKLTNSFEIINQDSYIDFINE